MMWMKCFSMANASAASAVAISHPGKMTYVMGRFEGTVENAEAVAEYAAHHAASDSGVVPFRSWPQGVKGHFVARIPPVEDDAPVPPSL